MHPLELGLNVLATAAELGYSGPCHFSRMFKRALDLSPRDHMHRPKSLREAERPAGLAGLPFI